MEKNPRELKENVPQIAYVQYQKFVTQHGIELVGWPEHLKTQDGNLLNISKFPHVDDHRELYHGLTHGMVYWRPLGDDEWKARKLADPSAVVVPNTQSSLSGGLQSASGTKRKNAKSGETARKKAKASKKAAGPGQPSQSQDAVENTLLPVIANNGGGGISEDEA